MVVMVGSERGVLWCDVVLCASVIADESCMFAFLFTRSCLLFEDFRYDALCRKKRDKKRV